MHKLFGIETVLLERASPAERQLLRRVMLLFMIIIALSMLAGGYFVFMINSSYVVAVVGGLFIGFVIFSMLRFSSVTLTRRLHEPDQKFRFFSSSFLVRLLLICILGVMIGFPFSAFVLRYGYSDEIEQRRSEIIEEYRASKENSKLQSNKRLMDREKALRVKGKQDSLALIDLKEEVQSLEYGTDEFKAKRLELVLLENETERDKEKISRLKQELHVQDSVQSAIIQIDLKSFTDEISKSELPMFQMRHVGSTPEGWLVIAGVIVLFAWHFILYLRFIFGKTYRYAKDAATYYKESIASDYLLTKKEITALLGIFSYDYAQVEHYQDPPFNTIPVEKEEQVKLTINLQEYLQKRKYSGQV